MKRRFRRSFSGDFGPETVRDEYLRRGRRLFSLKDYESAKRVFSQLIRSHPRWVEARVDLGRTLVEQKRFDEAVDCFTELICRDIDPYRGFFCCGVTCLWSIKDYDRAVEYLNRAIECRPDQDDPYLNRAIAHERKGDYPSAFADYDKALALNPEKSYAWYRRGWLRSRNGDYDRAIEDIDKAIALCYGTNPSYHLQRGYARHMKGEYDLAFEDYCKTIHMTWYYDKAFFWRGLVYCAKGFFQLAVADFNFALKMNPKNADCYFYRGCVFFYDLGKYDLALADLTKAVELSPDRKDFRDYLAMLHKRIGNADGGNTNYVE